jgi:transcriptional regulator with XRE-family HTH domain
MYPNLKLQLWRTGIRQNRLAQLVGVDETLLSKIVNGFREPNPQLRVKIAAALQSDETWLFESVDGHPPSEDGLPAVVKTPSAS